MTCFTWALTFIQVAMGLATTLRHDARSPGRVRDEENLLRELVDLFPKNSPIHPVYIGTIDT